METLLLKKKRNKTQIKMAKNHLEKSKNPAKEISKKNSKQKLQTTIKKTPKLIYETSR